MVARTLTVEQIAALRLPTAEQVRNVTAAIPQLELGTWRNWDPRPGVFLEVGPGIVRMFSTSAHLPDAARDRYLESSHREIKRKLARERAVYRSPMALLNNSDLASLDPRKQGRVNTSTGRITGWSARSKRRMDNQIRRIDFTPLFASGLEPAMVTLTMPGKDDHGHDTWADFAPTPAAFKAIVNRFTVAYRDAWHEPLYGVWKMEFQHRGAPHLHILMTPPDGIASSKFYPFEFKRWLSEAWAHAVGSEGSVRVNHIKAGTGIDYVGEAYRDPQRIATYFGKHGTFAAKDYQNDMPAIWRDAVAHGEQGARFWGVWGLKKASAVLQLNDVGNTTVETLIDPLGVSRVWVNITQHYRRNDDGTWVLVEERRPSATDASWSRAYQRMADDSGSRSSDAVKVQRYMRKVSKARAMRGQPLVKNKHGQLVLAPTCVCEYRVNLDGRRVRTHLCSAHVVRRIKFEAPDRHTGEIRTIRRYRIGYYVSGSGTLLVNDGLVCARDVQRILDTRARWTEAA